jgi:hypothetical protein
MSRIASLMNFKVLITALLAVFISSCSANYHLRRAIKKGYRCDEIADTIKITSIDSIQYVLNDSIYFERVLIQKDTIVRYKRSFVPKTRFQTRIEYKLKRDTLKMIEKVEVVKWKTAKREKAKPNILLLVLGFVMGMFTTYLLRNFKTIL